MKAGASYKLVWWVFIGKPAGGGVRGLGVGGGWRGEGRHRVGPVGHAGGSFVYIAISSGLQKLARTIDSVIYVRHFTPNV